MMNIFGCFSKTFTNAANSSLLYTEPVGLQGEEHMNIVDICVIASSNCSGVILKSLSIVVSINTDLPSAKVTISEYDTQYGVGIITSSPGLISVRITFDKDCLAPVDTTICEIS